MPTAPTSLPAQPRADAHPPHAVWRPWLERGLHALGIAALVLALWVMFQLLHLRPLPAEATSSALAQRLPAWSHQAPASAQIQVDAQPDAASRAWLQALQQTGTSVGWQATAPAGWQPAAISLQPLVDPHPRVSVWTAHPWGSGAEVRQTDPAALPGGPLPAFSRPLAELEAQVPEQPTDAALSAAVVLGAPGQAPAWTTLRSAAGVATAALRDALTLKPVLLLGQASWEARFVTAALEEHGWQVDARLQLSPAQIVGQTPVAASDATGEGGAPAQGRAGGRAGGGGGREGGRGGGGGRDGASGRGEAGGRGAGGPASPEALAQAAAARGPEITTDNYAAVIVLDAGAARYAPAIERFVEAGGGLIVLGQANRVAALRPLLPAGGLGVVQEATPFETDPLAPDAPITVAAATPAAPVERLELLPLTQLHEGALALESRGTDVVAAVQRLAQGRVLQIGYTDTWRWRMAHRDADAPQAYREWLAQWLTVVAHAPRSDRPQTLPEVVAHDPAPLAAWHAAFGPAHDARQPDAAAPSAATAWSGLLSKTALAVLFVIAALAMLLQWLSRRLRGAS